MSVGWQQTRRASSPGILSSLLICHKRVGGDLSFNTSLIIPFLILLSCIYYYYYYFFHHFNVYDRYAHIYNTLLYANIEFTVLRQLLLFLQGWVFLFMCPCNATKKQKKQFVSRQSVDFIFSRCLIAVIPMSPLFSHDLFSSAHTTKHTKVFSFCREWILLVEWRSLCFDTNPLLCSKNSLIAQLL